MNIDNEVVSEEQYAICRNCNFPIAPCLWDPVLEKGCWVHIHSNAHKCDDYRHDAWPKSIPTSVKSPQLEIVLE